MLRQIVFISMLSMLGLCEAQERDSIITYQKEVVAKLTGKKAIDAGLYLGQRATYEERSLTANYLASALKNSGWTFEFHEYRTAQSNFFLDLFFRPNKGINVIGKLPASVPTQKHIILGAHYDTERNTPGAVDNASGVALCLALAKELQQLKNMKYHVSIVFFDQEEDDEVGSTVFVNKMEKEKLEVHSVHIFDLIGYDSDGDFALTLQSPAPFLEDIYREEAQARNIPIQLIGGASSDNKPFLDAGYATVHPFEEMDDRTPYYHSPQDTYDTVNFGFLARTTQYMGSILSKILKDNYE